MRWDWSKVKVHLVPSIAGKHEGWPSVLLSGHPRLMKVVQNMGMRVAKGVRKEVVLECQVRCRFSVPQRYSRLGRALVLETTPRSG